MRKKSNNNDAASHFVPLFCHSLDLITYLTCCGCCVFCRVSPWDARLHLALRMWIARSHIRTTLPMKTPVSPSPTSPPPLSFCSSDTPLEHLLTYHLSDHFPSDPTILSLDVRVHTQIQNTNANAHVPTTWVVHWWKHKFTSECMNTVYDQAFGSKTPTHSTIMQMDRKLRSFPVPPLLQIAGFGSSESRMTHFDSVPLILQRHVVLAIRESREYPNSLSPLSLSLLLKKKK